MDEPLWSNWSGSATSRPAWRALARDEAEVAAAVRRATSEGVSLRTVGTGHSQIPLAAADGGLLQLDVRDDKDARTCIEQVDPARQRARVWAGATLHTIGEALHQLGLALPNLGDVDVQTLGGAIGTGTHGTGRALKNISGAVVGVRGIDARGEIFEWNQDSSPNQLAAAQVSLGTLGVICSVDLQLRSPLCLHERTDRMSVSQVLESIEERATAARHVEFFWYPARDRVDLKTLVVTDDAPDPLPDRRYESVDWSHRILPSVRTDRFVEMEYALPAAAAFEVFAAVRERMRARHPGIQWPVELRFVAADDAWLSPATGRDSITLSLHQDARLPFRAFFADIEPLLREGGGRPHWGKWHSLVAADLEPLYPRWAEFAELRSALDSEGRFLNPYLRDLLVGRALD
ncbi:MAG: D-arabinono-1,4-lactone oxidase [Myxococcota bacterium]|nr:D-arabinono-1,4-lactone oxidase [Myxococcota bacterium]